MGRIRKHLTPATFIAFVALVFALTGGAFAASSNGGGSGSKATASAGNGPAIATTAKKKAKTKAGARGPAGPQGKAGANGATGAAGATGPGGAGGATGPIGPEGKAGTAGAPGESVIIKPLSKGSPACEEGGAEFKVGVSTGRACNGTTGYTPTLPSKATETGTWSFSAPEATAAVAPVSFAIPLEKPLEAADVHYLDITEWSNKTGPAGCPGTAEKPEAAAGQFCAYGTSFSGTVSVPAAIIQNSAEGFPNSGASKAGAVIFFGEPESGGAFAFGTWAVTAP